MSQEITTQQVKEHLDNQFNVGLTEVRNKIGGGFVLIIDESGKHPQPRLQIRMSGISTGKLLRECVREYFDDDAVPVVIRYK
jgi:hypothetical protein